MHVRIGENDLRDVLKEVHQLKDEWFMLGIHLGLSAIHLKAIEMNFNYIPDRALTEMLLVWLKEDYNVLKDGHPTWRRLVEAVDSESVGMHLLAKKIASKHPTSTCMFTHLCFSVLPSTPSYSSSHTNSSTFSIMLSSCL